MPHAFRLPRVVQYEKMREWETSINESKLSMVTVAHPTKIGYVASIMGAFFGSFIFVSLLNIGTGLLVDHCTIAADGTPSGTCSYVPVAPVSAQQIGTHPEWITNLLLLAAVAYGARYVAQHVAGLWSQGDIDAHFTILRALKAFAVKDEPVLLGHRAFALLGQAIGSFSAVLFTWAMLQGRTSYKDGGEGLGGPGVSTRGLQNAGRTIFLAIFIGFVRSLVFLWAVVERKWTAQKGTNVRGGEIISYNKYDTDHVSTGLTHHAKAGMLATVDGVLVAVTGAVFGPAIGFFWRDLFTNILTEHTALVNEGNEGFSLWLLSFVMIPIGNIIALGVCFLMLIFIRESRKEQKEKGGD